MKSVDGDKKYVFLFIILLVSCVTGIASDLYAPSMPSISQELDVSIDRVQWSMAIYMLGVSLFQFFYGSLSDIFGRKPILLLGLSVFFVGSLICFFSSDIEWLIFGRFIQGSGAAACAALWRAIFRDVFKSEELAKYGSYLSVIMVFVLPAAPALGGYLQQSFGWRSSFLFLELYALLALIIVAIKFNETSQHHHISRLKFSFIASAYLELLRNRVFMGYCLAAFLTFGAFFSWFVIGPVLIIEILQYSPKAFGALSFLSLCTAMSIGSNINARLVQRFGLDTMLNTGWLLIFLGGVIMALGYLVFGMTAVAIFVPVILVYFGSTFIFANTFAGAFANIGTIAGSAGGLYGSIQIAGGAVIGGLIAYLPEANQLPLAFIYIVSSALAWIAYTLIVKPVVKPS